MTLTTRDYNCLVGFLAGTKNAKEAKTVLQMWFDEKAAEVYKEGWLDACEEYDVKDDRFTDEDEDDAGDIIYDGY